MMGRYAELQYSSLFSGNGIFFIFVVKPAGTAFETVTE